MNDKFRNFLRLNNWQLTPRDHKKKSYEPDIYVKTYTVKHNGTEKVIPIAAEFINFNNNDLPSECTLTPFEHTELSPSYHKRATELIGADRIITCLDQGGLMMAMKYLVHCFSIKSYKREAKLVLERCNGLPD